LNEAIADDNGGVGEDLAGLDNHLRADERMHAGWHRRKAGRQQFRGRGIQRGDKKKREQDSQKPTLQLDKLAHQSVEYAKFGWRFKGGFLPTRPPREKSLFNSAFL
jgi:hypothetical protein